MSVGSWNLGGRVRAFLLSAIVAAGCMLLVGVTGANAAQPIVNDVFAGTNDVTPVVVHFDATDPDEHDLTYSIVNGPGNGTLGAIDQENGTVTYTANPDFAGIDEFVYRASDGTYSGDATASIVVRPDTGIAGPSGLINDSTPTFTFSSPQSGVVFECRIDGAAYSSCPTPFTTDALADGSHTIDVRARAGSAVDNSPASLTVNVDATEPTPNIEIAPAQANPTNVSPIAFRLFSSEALDPATVTESDFEVANGTIDEITGSGIAYVIQVVPDAEGDVTLDPSDTYEVADLAGNATTYAGNAARTVTYDVTAPEVTLEQPDHQADPTNDASVEFELTASEPLDHATVNNDDFDVTNGSIDSITLHEGHYDIAVTAAGDGVVSIAPSDDFSVTDPAGNEQTSVDGDDRDVTYDSIAPEVVLEQAAGQPDPTIDTGIEFTLSADEALDADTVTASDFVVDNATLDSVTGSGDEYTIAVTAASEAPVSIDLSETFEVADPAGNTTDTAGGTDRSVLYDTPPDLTLEQAEGQVDPTNVAAIEFTLSADEDLNPATVDASDFDVTNGSITGITGDEAVYTIAVNASADGDVEIAPSGTFSVSDLLGNPETNIAGGTDRTVTYDTVAPDADITTTPSDPSFDPTPTFVFESNEEGSTFECRIWDVDDAPGSFEECPSPFTSPILDGNADYRIEVRAIDPAGNTGAAVDYSWHVNPVGIVAQAGSDPYFTRGGAPVAITVLAEDSEDGELTYTQVDATGGGTVGSFEVDGDEAIALYQSANGFAGIDTVTIRVRNVDTNAWTDVQVNVAVRPETRLTGGPGVGATPALTNTNTPTFTFEAVSGPDDGVVSGVGFTCKLDGNTLPTLSCANGSFTPNLPLADGDHTFEVRASKPSLNIDDVPQVTNFTIDTVAPEAPELDGTEGLIKVDELSYAFEISEGWAECRLIGPADADPAWDECESPAEYIGVDDGDYTFEVRTVDAAGNRSDVSSLDATVDTIVEVQFGDVPVDGNRDGRPVVTFSSDEDPHVDYSYRLFPASIEDEDERPEFAESDQSIPLPLLDQNIRYRLEVKGVDRAGNETIIHAEWDQENTAPVAPSPDVTGEAGTEIPVEILSTDADDDSLFYDIVSDVTGGEITAIDEGDGIVTFVADEDEVGIHTFDFEVTDRREGGTVQSTATVRIQPNTVFTEEPPAETQSVRPTWSFESPAGPATFECNFDGNGWEACDNGTFTPDADLAEGTYTLEVRATVAGLTDPTPATSTIVVDVTAPDISLYGMPDALSNEVNPVFEFESSDLTATFECSIDEGDWAECESGEPLSPALEDGDHSFRVRPVDPGQNVGPIETFEWEVDATKPVIEILSGPEADGWTNARRPVWEFEESDLNLDDAATTCQVDNQAVVEDCLSPWQPASNLNDGLHEVTFTATDNAGNVETVQFSFRVTTITPTVVIDEGPASPSGPTAQFSFRSTTDLGETGGFECRMSLNGGPYTGWAACDADLTLEGLSSGTRTIQVRAVDSGGNHSTGAAVASWTWSTIGGAPDTAITGQTLNRGNAAFGFNSPGNPLATFECRIDEGDWEACTSPQSYSGLAVGEHTFQVRATNQVGTTDASPAEHVWTVNAVTAPDTAIDQRPSAETTATTAAFRFSSSDSLVTFECRIDGGAWEACSSPNEYTGLAVGDHAFEVRAKNQEGLVDESPAKFEWKVIADYVDPGEPQKCNPIKRKVSRSKNVRLAKRLNVRVQLSHRQAIAGQVVTARLLVNNRAPKGKLNRRVKKALKRVELISKGAIVARLGANKWTAKFEAGDDTPKNLRVLLKRKKGKALRSTAAFALRSCGNQ